MNYAIEVLEKDKALIDKCLSTGNWRGFQEAFERRKKKSKELEKAIILLKLITQ